MNKMLEQAIAAVSALPDQEQEAIACLMLEEVEAERGWDERFAKSEGKLAVLARRAKARHVAGETSPLIFPKT